MNNQKLAENSSEKGRKAKNIKVLLKKIGISSILKKLELIKTIRNH